MIRDYNNNTKNKIKLIVRYLKAGCSVFQYRL